MEAIVEKISGNRFPEVFKLCNFEFEPLYITYIACYVRIEKSTDIFHIRTEGLTLILTGSIVQIN